jgi:hypothetical protein
MGAAREVIGCGLRREYREDVALRREDLSPEQLEHQRALDRSWAEAQRDLADPEFRGHLEQSLRRLDTQEPPPSISREDFLAQTEPPAQ